MNTKDQLTFSTESGLYHIYIYITGGIVRLGLVTTQYLSVWPEHWGEGKRPVLGDIL